MIHLKQQYLDDLDPRLVTDEQRQAMRELYERDPYSFYALWRDPTQAQIWAEGEGFKTTPADELYAKIGSLRLARAPEVVIDSWKETLVNHNRPTEDWSDMPPKTKPIKEKLDQIDELCKYLDGLMNWVENNMEPDEPEPDFPDIVPFAGKWHRLMQRAVGNLIVNHHNGTVRHYKETEDGVEANMGVEIVEIILEDDGKLSLDLEEWANDYIKPEGANISKAEDGKTKIILKFYDCYK